MLLKNKYKMSIRRHSQQIWLSKTTTKDLNNTGIKSIGPSERRVIFLKELYFLMKFVFKLINIKKYSHLSQGKSRNNS